VRRVSPKQAKAYREHGPARDGFLADMEYRCVVCGKAGHPDVVYQDGPFAVHVHEMTPGPNRMKAFGRREAWLPACNVCNGDALTDRKLWPLAEQLVLKIECDPEWFSIEVINEILAPPGRLVHVVTAEEVLARIVERRKRERFTI
jgi:hypothetical protein